LRWREIRTSAGEQGKLQVYQIENHKRRTIH
jgi:hypothetical protein